MVKLIPKVPNMSKSLDHFVIREHNFLLTKRCCLPEHFETGMPTPSRKQPRHIPVKYSCNFES
jgi:hypothetical protein